jgi:putative ABC transport system permease protein
MLDLKFALRAFLKTPGFTAVAVLTLALGIGATTAIFSVVHAVLLRPLPYPNAERLAVARLSMPDYKDLRASVSSFEATAVWATNLYNLRTQPGADTQQVLGGVISRELLPLLGVDPVLGRNFTAEDERGETVILGYGLWQSRFGGDPSVLGRAIELSGTSYTVIGIAPSWFSFPSSEFQLWAPIGLMETKASAQAANRGLRIMNALALLKPGVTLQAARGEVAALSAVLARTYPATNESVTIELQPLYDRIIGRAGDRLGVVLATVGLLLLIACANVANLMLARTTTRERELAIRTALGAARSRLVRQILTESLVLATAGGMLGLLVASWGVEALPSLLAGRLPRAETIGVDGTVLTFALLATMLTAVCFGVAPALHASGGPLASLKEGGRSLGGGPRGRRVRHAIAVAEVALAVMVMVGAALLVRSFLALTARDPGFDANGLISFNVQFVARPDPEWRARSAEQVLERVSAVPGVTAAGGATGFPPVTAQRGTRFEVEGRVLRPEEASSYFIAATPGYFTATRTPVRAGRAFERTDSAGAPLVVLINEELASSLFPNEDPIGKRLRLVNPEHSNAWRTIVGVVGNVKYRGLEEGAVQTVYTPFAQTPFMWLYFMVRADAPVTAAIRAAVPAADAALTAGNVRLMNEVVAGTVTEPRFQTLLVASFAGLALVLAAIGIYGVIAYSVAQRTQEIGIRVALGAAAADVVTLVVREGVLMAAAGVAIGLAGAAFLSRLLSSMLVDVAPRDPLAFGAAALLLLTVAVAASYLPARRALRVDPMTALRGE